MFRLRVKGPSTGPRCSSVSPLRVHVWILCLIYQLITTPEISTRTHSSSNGAVLILFQITFYKHSTRALGHEAETCLYFSENFLLLALQKVIYKGYATVSLSINYLLYKNYGVFFLFYHITTPNKIFSGKSESRLSCLVLWKSFRSSQIGMGRVLALGDAKMLWSVRIGSLSPKEFMWSELLYKHLEVEFVMYHLLMYSKNNYFHLSFLSQ